MLIRSDRLEVEVLPEVGGKVAQIRNLRTGCTILVPPQAAHASIPKGARWIDYDVGGMDDCFPNVDECEYPKAPWQGVRLPQLGEWVYGSWHVVDNTSGTIRMERTGTALPYRASKSVGFSADGELRFDYAVENLDAAPIQYLWSAHSLIAVADEFELVLPGGNKTFTTFPPTEVYKWPDFNGVDLTRTWISPGQNLKIFISGLRKGECALRQRGSIVRFRFDIAAAPVLGLWFNNFAFPRDGRPAYRCIAIEPCTSPSDVLDGSESSRDRILQPGAKAEWSLSISVD